MRCREALRSIGPYIDGELAAERGEALKSHLEACPSCRRRMASLRGVLREVSSLAPIEPAPAESARLLNRVRAEMERPAAVSPADGFAAAARPAVRWAHVTAAAVSVLVLVTGAAALAVIESGGPAMRVEEAAEPEAEATGTNTFDKTPNASNRGDEAYAGTVVNTIPASLAQPALFVSGKEYTRSELEDFRGDIPTRLKFYSAYWQPQAAGAAAAEPAEELRPRLAENLAAQAQAAGADPEGLRSAVNAALARPESENLLPCYAELAKVEGREVWLLSFSGPEDCFLFPDPEVPQSVVLASLSGEEGMKISRSLLQELVAELAPIEGPIPGGETIYWGMQEGEAASGAEEAAGTVTPEPDGGEAPSGPENALPRARWELDFQAFLDEVAARTNNLDAIKALERLNYEQVLMLLKGDWAGLAADGVNLSEFVSPPQRLWAVDAATAEVVWSP